MNILFTIILMIFTVIGYVLLGRTKYLYIVFILMFSRFMYWILLAAEWIWESSTAESNGVNTSSSSNSFGWGHSILYEVYPWRHTILFDVIPIIMTLIPYIIYFLAKDKNAINNPINVRVRKNNTVGSTVGYSVRR